MPADNSPTAVIASNARLETKIDLILDRLKSQDDDIKSIRSRVEDLERARAHSKGMLAVLSAFAGIVGHHYSPHKKLFPPLAQPESIPVNTLHPEVENFVCIQRISSLPQKYARVTAASLRGKT